MINTSNVLFCTGRLTKNVELHTKGSTTVGRFTVAVNRIGSTKQGGNQPTADFISWTVFGKTAENLANNCGKGSLIQVAGGVQNNNYQDKEGKMVYGYNFVAESITYLDSKKPAAEQQAPNGYAPQQNAPSPQYAAQNPYQQAQAQQYQNAGYAPQNPYMQAPNGYGAQGGNPYQQRELRFDDFGIDGLTGN